MKKIILGNEAIVQGALESGVNFVSTYPGTPASEIGDVFYKIGKEAGVYFEFSTNEKVALEAGIGASFSGLKTLVAMKNFGANVCLDALLPFLYTGAKGPAVIVVADDPSCHGSAQSEENSRGISYLAHIPTIEPSDPQECKDFTKLAFEISEKFKIPVMLRTTTRVAHQRALVQLSRIAEGKLAPYRPDSRVGTGAGFVKDYNRFVTMPPRVLEQKQELLDKIRKIADFSERSKVNLIEGDKNSEFGIITSGVSYLYVKEALQELSLNLPILKLGFFYPLPEKKIKNFIKNLKEVLIVEELEPFLEKEIKILAKEVNPKLKVSGKNLLPEVGELTPDKVALAFAKFTGKKYKIPRVSLELPKRFPRFCDGCPYWLVFPIIKKVLNPKEVIFGGDIGCYMLGALPPHSMLDYLSCMGSSIGIAHGIKKSIHPHTKRSSGVGAGQKVVAFIGDSTFFHAGIPALINTIFNKSNPLIIVLENQITAMTGHQPHPGVDGIKIENVVKGLGIKNVKTIDPINQKEFIETLKDFSEKDEVSVIIASRICALYAKKLKQENEKR